MPPLFVPLSKPSRLMGAQPETRPSSEWTIAGAETLLASLAGVLSARVVAKPGGDVQEIHLLTTNEVGAKQTVRNVESALLAHFDLTVDHRKISVAQTSRLEPATRAPNPHAVPAAAADGSDERVLLVGVRTESQRSQIRFDVELEWKGRRYCGKAAGADVASTRMTTAAGATLAAVEALARGSDDATPQDVSLVLVGLKLLEAFERRYVLVAVHALSGRQVQDLSGLAGVEDSPERAVILATLQAADRWIRGRI